MQRRQGPTPAAGGDALSRTGWQGARLKRELLWAGATETAVALEVALVEGDEMPDAVADSWVGEEPG